MPHDELADEVKRRLGWQRLSRLEFLVAACIAIVFVGGVLFGVLLWQTAKKVDKVTTNTNTVVRDLPNRDQRLAEQFARQEEALRELARREALTRAELQELREQRQTIIVIERRGNTDRERVIVVQPTPTPQPTATVTCDPTPIIGDPPCRRGQR